VSALPVGRVGGLRVDGLGKRYGDLSALERVTFQAQPGELIALLGRNGAGKTTLLSILAGAQSPTSGSVAPSRARIGWVPQQPALYSKLSVAENLALFARLGRVADPREAVEEMLEQTGLRERADEQVGRLSGGNRQRVNVAIGLIGAPEVFVLDEPTASLDPAQRERLWGFLAGLAEAGRTVVFSTHSPSEAQRHASRVLVLDRGRLRFDGAPAQLIERSGAEEPDLEAALVAFLAGDTGAQEPGR
jgi:ABC-2 type transport system ATP-binding protein